MRISLTSVPIGDYDQALDFYVGKLGFEKKHDIPLGDGARWVTVVSPEDPDGPTNGIRPRRRTDPVRRIFRQPVPGYGGPSWLYSILLRSPGAFLNAPKGHGGIAGGSSERQ